MTDDLSRKTILKILFIQEIGLIISAILWLFFRNFSSLSGLKNIKLTVLNPFKDWSISPKTILWGVLAGVILLILSSIISLTYDPFKKALKEIDSLILNKIESKDILLIALLSGIGEELFFRGILQLEIGIIWSSILFALLHIPGKEFVIYSFWALFASLFLGNIYSYTGNLFIVMLAHTVNNLLALILWRKFKNKFIEIKDKNNLN